MSQTVTPPSTSSPEPPEPRPGAEDSSRDRYLPEGHDGPVAAGHSDVDLDLTAGRPMRSLLPTARQLAVGAAPASEAVGVPGQETVQEQATHKPPLRARFKESLSFFNPVRITGPRTPLLVFGGMALLAGWDDVALGLVAPELRTEFGLSIQFLAVLGAIEGIVGQLMSLPIGYLTDRVKRVWLVRMSAIGTNIGTVFQAIAVGVGGYVFGRGFGRATGLIDDAATFPLMADYYPSREIGRAGAFIQLCGRVGSFVATPVVGFLILRYGWRPATLALAVVALVVSLATFLLREPVRGGMDRLEMGASREVAAQEQEPLGWQASFRAAWSIKTVRLAAVATVIAAFTTPVGILIQLAYAERFLLDPFQRSLIATLTAVAGFVPLLFVGPVTERLLSKRPATVMLLQAMLGFAGLGAVLVQAFATNLALFMAPAIVLGMVGALFAPVSATIMVLVIPARIRGLGMRVTVPFMIAGQLIGARLAGFADTMTMQSAILLFGPFYLIGALLSLAAVSFVTADIRAARAAALAGAAVEKAREVGLDKLLVVRDLDVNYGDTEIISHLDLDVERGETLALLGTNGAGKSTLLRAICGLTMADNGAIVFDNVDVTPTPPHEMAELGVVYLPGGKAIFPTMTVRENLDAAAWVRRHSEEDAPDALATALELFPELEPRLDSAAGTLSGGEQQMVAVVQALLMEPKLLLVDELSLGLAPAVVDRLVGALREVQDAGTTIVVVEQSLNVASTIADRAVFLDKGAIEFDGPIDELLSRDDLVRAIFMGGAVSGARYGRRASADEAETVLEGESITVRFGGVTALDHVDFSVMTSEVVGIIGPNGAGKTTLFDALSGYQRIDHGTVRLHDEDVTKLPPHARARRGLGRSFQNARLFPDLTVRDTIAVALEKRANRNPLAAALYLPGARRQERRLQQRIDGYIDLLGLGAHADKFVYEISTGTRRAVEIACVMAYEPEVLLLDEPSSGLAQAETEALGPALLRIVSEVGCSLVVIEHDLPLLTAISDRLVAMELGRVIASGPPDQVTTNPRVLESYLNASAEFIERSGSRVSSVMRALADETPEDRNPS